MLSETLARQTHLGARGRKQQALVCYKTAKAIAEIPFCRSCPAKLKAGGAGVTAQRLRRLVPKSPQLQGRGWTQGQRGRGRGKHKVWRYRASQLTDGKAIAGPNVRLSGSGLQGRTWTAAVRSQLPAGPGQGVYKVNLAGKLQGPGLVMLEAALTLLGTSDPQTDHSATPGHGFPPWVTSVVKRQQILPQQWKNSLWLQIRHPLCRF